MMLLASSAVGEEWEGLEREAEEAGVASGVEALGASGAGGGGGGLDGGITGGGFGGGGGGNCAMIEGCVGLDEGEAEGRQALAEAAEVQVDA